VRNVAAHAGANRLDIELVMDGDCVRLVVADDGRGFSEDELDDRRRQGHVGLRLLTGLVTDAGGTLDVDSAPGRGTRLQLELPVSAV